ncbi:GPI transamidase component PIG-T [Carpediemonas membranifera]|uniref:GPI transamidase component PIG-T n=1 Tax=Carpediemonas membranifera TaxID=201153 RepID=A0A8J6B2Z9_9EUKA|nr:GPI transamidase component PIG-T [Carpediemonas membranifera]|eukprot:KAG9393184.1 GPI transamidase component PIG-T [Carpediemonas membranifera]
MKAGLLFLFVAVTLAAVTESFSYNDKCVKQVTKTLPFTATSHPFITAALKPLLDTNAVITVNQSNSRTPFLDENTELCAPDFGVAITLRGVANPDSYEMQLRLLATELEIPLSSAFTVSLSSGFSLWLNEYPSFNAISKLNRLARLTMPQTALSYSYASIQYRIDMGLDVISVSVVHVEEEPCPANPPFPTRPRVRVAIDSDSKGGVVSTSAPAGCSGSIAVQKSAVFQGVDAPLDTDVPFTHGPVPTYEWPPDASHGIAIPPVVVVLECTESGTFEFIKGGYVVRPPQPDFSMGYNATLLCIVVLTNLVMTVLRTLGKSDVRGEEAGEGAVEKEEKDV